MGKDEVWLASFPADRLEEHLEGKSPHVRTLALRYFLEFEHKGKGVLEKRRRKLAAELLLRTLGMIDRHVAKDQREDATLRVKKLLLRLVLNDLQ